MALVRLAQADAGETAELRVGDTVELELPEVRTSGYQWRWQLPEAVRVVADDYVRGDGHPGAAGRGDLPPGAGGMRRLAFDIVGAGRHLVRAELARPWEGEPRRSVTFVLAVTEGTEEDRS
ncbi:protease inhibitor I42 family protein [Amycolatopsis cynarae]|uniref:Protease inhibitor I42 family protein n=1 Tax=Amycolatopsis cynarae TaxID=2995223 RepID=A0ABY7B0X6_9PSEU|nr:protease inhibitor I42 family protein [Amycolatopsis sp. HUAS 11-8]WAL65343.1 protease inhibitor I42 family protein [Amycolatopsis sp. HUAS 11-8]